jgi:hypothetical protein
MKLTETEQLPAVRRPTTNHLWFNRPLLVLTLLLGVCLAPFINKAIHIDDPLFVWSAQWVPSHPVDFYGFRVNWYGSSQLMAEVNNNPPLASFYLALVGSVLGWSEPVLHLAFLLPALAAVWGMFFLARSFCGRPLLAAAAALVTPAFLMCSSSLMCDTLMLAFWIWAMIFWCNGLDSNRIRLLAISGTLAGLCLLTKFSGIMLLPLLCLLGFLKRRRIGTWMFPLLIPVVFLVAYEWHTARLYGHPLFQAASVYSAAAKPLLGGQWFEKLVVGLSFTGGCLFSVACLTPLLGRKWWLLSAALVSAFAILFCWHGRIGLFPLSEGNERRWDLIAQATLFCVAGAQVLALAAIDWWQKRDADSLWLFCWMIGVFVFATMFNWSVNGRSLLPMAPAAAILVVRRLSKTRQPEPAWRPAIPLIASTCLSLTVLSADYAWANSTREGARELYERYKPQDGTLWFQGHWGFQYYMERLGAQPLDQASSRIALGDRLIVPSKNSTPAAPPPELVTLLERFELRRHSAAATMSRSLCAGFYSDLFGALPFAIGADEPDFFYVLAPNVPFQFPLDTRGPETSLDEAALARALSAYRSYLAAHPNDAEAHYQLGVFLMDRGSLTEALDRLREAVRLNPAHARAHEHLGLLADRRNQTGEAVSEYRLALRLNPALPGALNNLAWILATHSDPAVRDGGEAVKLAKRACTLTSNTKPVFLGTLAAAYAEAGRFVEAVKTAERAQQLATAAGETAIAARNQDLLQLYRAGNAYHQSQSSK